MKPIRYITCSVWLLASAATSFALDYENKELGFSARLPDGLVDSTAIIRNQGPALPFKSDLLIARTKSHESESNLSEAVFIYDIGPAISREFLEEWKQKHQKDIALEDMTWKGFELVASKIYENPKGVACVTFNTQVPLTPHAIQVTVFGPASDEDRLRDQMRTILASIEGATNWSRSEKRAARFKPYLLPALIGLFALLAGKLRLTRRWGLEGKGARVAGVALIIAGAALPQLSASVLKFARSQGVGTNELWYVWIGFPCFVMWAIIFLIIRHYGNAYAEEPGYFASKKKEVMTPPEQKTEAMVTHCRMCQSLLPPEVQKAPKSCPNCGADLARWSPRSQPGLAT